MADKEADSINNLAKNDSKKTLANSNVTNAKLAK
jgi:hypothetical protein